jgi:tetratricopeptide (TPR) repeat protein
MAGTDDYTNVCFVIMPFGRKRLELVRKRQKRGKSNIISKVIDFDAIYDGVFEVAINNVELPEGGRLVARRADRDFFAGSIGREMFRYIEYSRFAVADITGLNPNVFLELGHRYRARESGTAVFRLPNAPIPFDINQIRAFAYEYRPDDRARESRELIARVLTESLRHNILDSPIQDALDQQWQGGPSVESILIKAENAVRAQDWSAARQYYERAVAMQPSNPLLQFRVGTMWRQAVDWSRAAGAFDAAVRLAPDYEEAHRELGIAQNRVFEKTGTGPNGIDALRTAIALNGEDFDALSALGGALRRAGSYAEALEQYRQATTVSHGHPYPLLNELKLEVIVNARIDVFRDRRIQLLRAEFFRRGQISQDPPIDSPWSFFDLAEIQLYLGRPGEFLRILEEGLVQPLTRLWQARTFRETLELLLTSLEQAAAPAPNGLALGIKYLRDAEPQLLV